MIRFNGKNGQRTVSTQTHETNRRYYFGQKIWSTTDDEWLWNNRSLDVENLAYEMDRTIKAIKARLRHFNDPNHKAFRGSLPSEISLHLFDDEFHSKLNERVERQMIPLLSP